MRRRGHREREERRRGREGEKKSVLPRTLHMKRKKTNSKSPKTTSQTAYHLVLKVRPFHRNQPVKENPSSVRNKAREKKSKIVVLTKKLFLAPLCYSSPLCR